MRARVLVEERADPSDSLHGEGYQCCFCGRGIEAKPPDICVLLLRTAYQENRTEPSQELFCHALCLKERLLPNIPTIL